MADATIKSTASAVIQELVLRANQLLGYPKVGRVANGATSVPEGVQMPEELIISELPTALTVDPATGETFLLVTDAFRPTVVAVQEAAQDRIDGAAAVSFDAEIVALTEAAVAYGDVPQTVFNPRSMANCAAWFRADTGVTSAADLVSAWNAYLATSAPIQWTQAVGANQPELVPAALNGRPAIQCDTDKWLQHAGAAFEQPMTLYIVGGQDNQVGNKTLVNTLDNGIRAGYNGGTLETTAGTLVPIVGVGTGTRVFEWVIDGANSRVGIDNSGPNLVNLGANDGTGIRFGANAAGGNGLVGPIFEVIYFSRVLTAQERRTVRSGLGAQYGMKVQ